MDRDNKELFDIGKVRTEPCLYPLMNKDILVFRDEMQISLDANANPTQMQPLVWSDCPTCVKHIKPYIIAVLPKWVWFCVGCVISL